jgi:glutaconate CoA-transferase subunit B
LRDRPGPDIVGEDRRLRGLIAPQLHDTKEAYLALFHPGNSVESIRSETAWDLRVAPDLAETPAPSALEPETVRALDPHGFRTR